MHKLVKRLEKRGWGRKDISKAVNIIENAKRSRTNPGKKIYWILLIVVAAANFAISVALIPLLISLKGFFLYFIIFAVGIIFGLLFELVIRSIEHLERRHHLFLAVIIPVAALANLLIISGIANEIASKLNLAVHKPLAIALVYAASFALPYLICKFALKMEYYSEE